MPTLGNEVRILLDDSGFWKESIVRQSIGTQEEFLSQLSVSVPITTLNVFKASNGNPAHMQTKGVSKYVFMELKEIRINTQWRGFDDGKRVYPVGAGGEVGDFGATFIWIPPANMKVWLVLWYGPNGTVLNYGATYMVASHKAGGTYRVPLPNLHSDSQVCMGNGFLPNREDNLRLSWQEKMEYALKSFNESPWNNDLREHTPDSCGELFSFFLDGKQVKAPTDWQRCCKKVNNSHYGDLPLQTL